MPGCGDLGPDVLERISRADAVLFDGTFWTDDEPVKLGIGTRTAREMDHMPISGRGGSLEQLAALECRSPGLHSHQQHQPDADRTVGGTRPRRCGRPDGRIRRTAPDVSTSLSHLMTTTLQASVLSAPPPPPIPDLAHPLAPEALADALRSFSTSYYANHPFHQLMHDGKLTKRQLQGWVANRLAYQRAIPRKDAAILSNCPEPDVRRMWMTRIVDHDGTEPGTGGIEMWVRLGGALGVPRDEMEDERHVLPGVRFATEAYVTFCKTRPWIEAVASSLTELFAPDLMRRRIEAFPKHYPWVDLTGLEYFRTRLVQAPRDSQQGLHLVTTRCTTVESQRKVFDALAFKLELLWIMIDSIHHAYGEP